MTFDETMTTPPTIPASDIVPVPTFDRDGYPTDDFLDQIENFAAHQVKNGYALLLGAVKAAWYWGDAMWEEEGGMLKLSTGGWSGNESIIGALKNNVPFWSKCWVSTRRGGHFRFEYKRAEATDWELP